MLRNLIETDVKAICAINQEALGYSFSPEETASQLARLSQDSHHSYLAMRMQLVMAYLDMSTLKSMNHFILKQDLIFQLQQFHLKHKGKVLVKAYYKGWIKKQKDVVMGLSA